MFSFMVDFVFLFCQKQEGDVHVATATFRFTSATPRRCVCDCLFSLSRDFMRLLVLQRFFYDQPTGVHVGD